MSPKIPAILLSLLLLVAAVWLVVYQGDSKVPAGDESWMEVAICAIDVTDDTRVPEGFEDHFLELEGALRSASVISRVSEVFRNVLPAANCNLQIESIKLEPVAGTNRVILRMNTSNPLVGAAILQEVLVRAEREFQNRTGLPDPGSSDLIRLKQKQIEFQGRIEGVRRELDLLLSSGSTDGVKIQSLRLQLENFERMDQAMKDQLVAIESLGEGMTFSEPILELKTIQSPTFDRVGLYQLQQYEALQRENRGLLSPLTPAMQDALEGKTGFTVE